MRILITIHSLYGGGAEKSLISLLQELEPFDFEIDLLVAWKNGLFLESVPKYVNVLDTPDDYAAYSTPLRSEKFPNSLSLKLKKAAWKIGKRILPQGDLSDEEFQWKYMGCKLKPYPYEYDLAIAYMNGFSSYYVIDKIKAKHKIVWVHNEYEKLKYSDGFERKYFKSADAIVTISEQCRESITKHFPGCKGRVEVLENISSPKLILSMAEAGVPEEIESGESLFNLISIGRLSPQKGFDIAVESAAILKKAGLDFTWRIIGEGQMRESLQKRINELGLQDRFILLGQRSNPYNYIKHSDIFVQPSRFEGKSIVLDEAKILAKPIVVTAYDTVVDSIHADVDGLVAEIDAASIAQNIMRICESKELRERLSAHLAESNQGNQQEIYKYVELFERVAIS